MHQAPPTRVTPSQQPPPSPPLCWVAPVQSQQSLRPLVGASQVAKLPDCQAHMVDYLLNLLSEMCDLLRLEDPVCHKRDQNLAHGRHRTCPCCITERALASAGCYRKLPTQLRCLVSAGPSRNHLGRSHQSTCGSVSRGSWCPKLGDLLKLACQITDSPERQGGLRSLHPLS